MLDVEERNKKYFFLIFFAGVIAQLALIFPSGLYWKGGYQFWGTHFHDGLWHLSIVQKLKYLSLENPVFAGERIRNYHYLSDFVIALIHKMTGVSIFDIFFRIFPAFVSFLIGVLTYKLAKNLFENEISAIWSMFFVFLGSNFAFILPFLGLGNPIIETSLWVQQPISIFTNFPLSFSIPIIFGALYLLKKYLENLRIKYFLLSILLFGLAPASKSFSVIFNLSLVLVGLVRLIIKKNKDLFLAGIFSLIIAFLLLSPTFKFDKHLIFKPGWFLKTMVEAPDRMNWQSFALKYQFYKEYGDIFNLAKFYFIAFLIFFFGNLGTRVVAFFGFPGFLKLLRDEVHQVLILSLILSLLIPMFFLTTGIAWNAIQFVYYFLFIIGLYSGRGMSKILLYFKKNLFKWLFSLLIILATIPVNFYTLWFYYHRGRGPDIKIEKSRLRSLEMLLSSGSRDDVVLTFPLEKSFIEVSAFSGKSTFLGDWLMAVVPGHEYDSRFTEIKESMKSKDLFENFLNKNRIKWIYIMGEEPQILNEVHENFSLYFREEGIIIYHVEKI